MKDYYNSFMGISVSRGDVSCYGGFIIGDLFRECNCDLLSNYSYLELVISEYITCIRKRLSGIWTSSESDELELAGGVDVACKKPQNTRN